MTQFTTAVYQVIKNFIVKNRRVVVILIHLGKVAVASYLAFLLRFEFIIPPKHIAQFISYLPFLLLIRLIFYLQSGLYKNLWRYSSVSDLSKIFKSVTFGTIIFLFFIRYVFGDISYPRSIYALDWLLLIMISGGSRLLVRVFREYLHSESSGKRTLLIGAGDAGEMIVRDMKNNPKYAYQPIGFIDDDPYKKGLSIHGVPIFGTRSSIANVIENHSPEEILISMPASSHKTVKEFYALFKPYNIPIKTLPGMSDILGGSVSVSQIKPLSLEDLLQREPVRTDIKEVKDFISGKSVLVTGAGGSIGSELCRQIFEYGPSRLILFDRYENGLFQIDREFSTKSGLHRNELMDSNSSPLTARIDSPMSFHPFRVIPIVGDMRDRLSVDHLFAAHRPEIVFHAAAHKHVPLMEHNPLEAVKNNIFGTKNILDAAALYNTDSFVMISTDKAVNPTSIMGATKHISELLTTDMNQSSSTKFTTVRFGNVLGSNGSVVQIFKDQLSRGGPITVTHPDIKRFFMLIPEAVQLVLTAAAAGQGGEIFVLDMGEQIKVVDLAENLIRLSGFIPYQDIQIEFSGLRPGEKLYEELFDQSEKIIPTFNEKLKIAVSNNVPHGHEFLQHIETLDRIVRNNAIDEIIPAIQKIIPGFKQSDLKKE
jgi:FlaA1/EpsC-like NDP-sugar epimerase